MENGVVKTITERPILKKPVVIEPLLAPDARNTFVLSGERLVKDSRLDALFKFQIGTNSLLTSVTTDATDKSPETIQGLVGSGISIAKMVAMAGDAQQSPLKELTARIAAIDREMVALAGGNDPKKQEAGEQDLNGSKTEERDVVYSITLDLAELPWSTNQWVTNLTAHGSVLGNFADSVVPQVTLEVRASEENHHNVTNHLSLAGKGNKGIFYRVPTQLRTRVLGAVGTKTILLFDNFVSFCQAGSINKVEARYKAFAKRKATVNFSTITGSVSEYAVEATSSSEAAAIQQHPQSAEAEDIYGSQRHDKSRQVRDEFSRQLQRRLTPLLHCL